MLFALATQADARTLTLTKSLKLKPHQGSYSFSVYFLETAPGKPSDEVISPGCWISVDSNNAVVAKGTYAITDEEFSGHDIWDRRYYYNGMARVGETSIAVNCKSYNRVNYNTVNRGLGGLIRISR
jgi:hypothetical protein